MEKSRKKHGAWKGREEPKQQEPVQQEHRQKGRNRRERKSRRKRSNQVLVASVIAAAVLLGMAAWISAYGFPAPIQAQIDIQPDADAKSGTLYAGERHAVDIGDFWMIVNQLPTVEEGNRECRIEYENPAENHYSARISLYLKEDGKLLGNTKRVDPGNYVETIRLKQELKPGEYPVTVRVKLFEEKTPVSELSLEITLRVVSQNQSAMK